MPADRDAELLEGDVRRSQDRIGDTVEEIEDKLSPREVARSVMGEDRLEAATEVFDVARRNPLPAALIAVGTIWLLATSQAPMIRRVRERLIGGGRSGLRPRSEEPAPVGPPPAMGEKYDRRVKRAR
jgi:hypothetical protein